MDVQTLINIAAGSTLAAIGWFARVLWEANKEMRKDLASLREEIPKTYVSKSDWKDSIKELKDILLQIDNKLDRKADK